MAGVGVESPGSPARNVSGSCVRSHNPNGTAAAPKRNAIRQPNASSCAGDRTIVSVTVQAIKQGVAIAHGEARIVVFVCPFQPFEGAIIIAAPGVDFRDLEGCIDVEFGRSPDTGHSS